MPTPRHVLILARILFVIGATGVVVLMLGPYQGLELRFGMTDKPAHAIAAFFATQALFAIAPRWRRLDLALAVLLGGALMEMAQGLTGRSMSMTDFAADALGVGVALMPGLIEQLRYHVRRSPNVSFADLRRVDRRKPRRRTKAGGEQPQTPAVARTRGLSPH